MLQFLNKFKVNYRWKKNSGKILDNNKPVIDRVLIATTLFNVYNKPIITNLKCSYFNIPTYTYNLQMLLIELQRIVIELEERNSITDTLYINDLKIVSLDEWCIIDPNLNFKNVNLWLGYELSTEFIKRILHIANTKNLDSYINRKCKRYFLQYLYITQNLGEIRYGSKKTNK